MDFASFDKLREKEQSGYFDNRSLTLRDASDPETLKVRRGVVAERYASVIDALYGGADSVLAEIEVTYEDGRKGNISGNLEIRDLKTFPRRGEVGAESSQAA